MSGKVSVVHNGIIENFRELKDELISDGYKFETETDTELLAKLVGHFYSGNLEKAVRDALHEVQGTYGIAAISALA